MFFCMWDRNFSQQQRVGIAAGMIVELLVGLMEAPSPASTAQKGAGGTAAGAGRTGAATFSGGQTGAVVAPVTVVS
jgi:hypothetical protein